MGWVARRDKSFLLSYINHSQCGVNGYNSNGRQTVKFREISIRKMIFDAKVKFIDVYCDGG